MIYRSVGLTVFVCLSVQCAARAPTITASDSITLDRADELVRDGCYRCLRQASEMYASLTSPAAGRALGRALRGAFDVTLLLAVREKEIGLAADASLARARALLARLSASRSTQPQGDLSMRLQAAEAVIGDLSGLDADERQRRSDRRQQREAEADTSDRLQRALHESAATDLIAAYLAMSIDCEQPKSSTSIEAAALSTQHGDPPLLRYRLAICSSRQPTSLTRLQEDDPRWAEAFFFEGTYEMGSPARSAEPVRAAALLVRAAEVFPESIAIHVMLARAQEMNGDFAAALASFDQVLALKPAHVDARLGRARNLSYLSRADEAVTAATELIDAGTWHVGDAYYWRAWNQYLARRLEPAWADVQEAMRLLANTSVYALAGSIAYTRKDLDTAVHHFDRALEMDSTNCAAASSAGVVHVDRSAWQLAADKYSKATNCFALAANAARADLDRLEQSAIESGLKATRLSTARKRIESAEDLSGQSALSAAQSYIRAGQGGLALTYIELAERHPGSRADARALRARIASVQ